MKTNKLIVYTVFGSELVRAVTEKDMDDVQYLMRTPHSVVKREFTTESEMKAYMQGLSDSSGWMESTCIDNTDCFGKSLIQFIEKYRIYKKVNM